jgi:preprotein translocase subunit SecA
MAADDMKDSVAAIREEVIGMLVDQYMAPGSLEEQWDAEGLAHALENDFAIRLEVPGWLKEDSKLNEEGVRSRILEKFQQAYDEKEQAIGSRLMRQVEKEVMLKQLDHHWKEHLGAMDYLRQGIHLRGYAQKNPKQEYKREAFEMFGTMLDQVKHGTISILARVRIQSEQDVQRLEAQRRAAQAMEFRHAEASALAQAPRAAAAGALGRGAGLPAGSAGPAAAAKAPESTVAPFVRTERKVGRNEPCPCGSGTKYKQCHGRLS